MNEVLFLNSREQDWKRLAMLCDRADVSPANLKPDELKDFVRLYRAVSSDLSLARTKSSNVQLIAFLNDLCSRAYSQIYRPPRPSIWRSLARLPEVSARTVRRRWPFVLASAIVFLGSAVFAFSMLAFRPDLRNHFVPPQVEENFKGWTHGEMEPRDAGQSLAGTLFYSSNNPFASVVTGASAAGSFGIVTSQLLYNNGALVGSLYFETRKVGRGAYLLIRILPHGVTELSGLVLSGSAGYVMAWALIAPGRRKRGEALKAAGKDAVVLLGTAVLMMYIAAPIEGFFSFNPLMPEIAKILFAAFSALAWGIFWVGYKRSGDLAEEDSAREAMVSLD
ncbi:MAG: stage II sporulation protein M [Armatimonadetes bacterium]|nr:stage II sporulation protein M [Armatimonadota bacterium]